jgi:hypothetical protein
MLLPKNLYGAKLSEFFEKVGFKEWERIDHLLDPCHRETLLTNEAVDQYKVVIQSGESPM